MKEITSVDNPKVKAWAKLSSSDDHFLVEGYHLVEEAIKAGYAEEIWCLKPYSTSLPYARINPSVLRKLAKTDTPEGIIAYCHKPLEKDEYGKKVLYLDRVQDPGNVGTLLRSALAFSFFDVVLAKGSASPYSQKALMASQGAIFHLNIHKDKEMGELKKLKEKGYFLMGTSLKGEEKLEKPEKNLVLILGNEGQGAKEEILSMCDASYKLVIHNIDSLNVAVAGSIFMHLLSE